MITVLLFDFDGTLVDTNELIIQSFMHTFDRFFPNRYSREDCISFIGPTLRETFGKIAPDRAEEMIACYRAFNRENHDRYIREFPGVYETIRTLHEHRFRLGIVTSKMKEMVHLGLEATRLRPFFPCIISVDEVANPKPHPESVLKAMEFFGARPEETLMIGDNYHDILAGKNAGTKTAGVAWSLKGKDYLRQFHPDYMLDRMSDLLTIVGVEQDEKDDAVSG